MRGRIAGAAAGLALLVMTAALGASAASAACPNEAFRTGPSALLPECRAYEMVTPVDKESALAVREYQGTSLVTPSGDGIFFYAFSAYAGAGGGFPLNPYIAGRDGDHWDVAGVSGPQAAQFYDLQSVLAVRDDLALALVISKEALAPGAIPFGSNLYLRDERTGAYTTIVAFPGNEAFSEWAATTELFVDASGDWSDILLSSTRVLAPGGVAGQPNLYEYREGSLRLAVAGGEPAVPSQAIPNAMSADGSRFYYKQGGVLYLHVRGQEEPILVSEDAEGNPSAGRFIGATPDDQVAFFVDGSLSLYRFEASAPAGKRLTDLAPAGAGEANVKSAFVGEDGTSAYFAAAGLLTPDAQPRPNGTGVDIYAWHGERGEAGGLRYLGKTEDINETSGLHEGFVSPNGRVFGFGSLGEVTPEAPQDPAGSCPGPLSFSPPGPCLNVFVYSLDTDRLVCASCTGAPQKLDSRLGGGFSAETLGPQSTPLLDDGSVFFETSAALVPRDVNGVGDVYRRRGGTTELVSTGTDLAPSGYIGVSADGSDIFIQTAQPLVGQDIDRMADLYDARVDGGLPQGAPQTPPSCIAAGDRRAGTTQPSPPERPGSGSFEGAGNVAGACDALGAKARVARKRSRSLARRAKSASSGQAKGLRRKAARQAKVANRLGRRARNCSGGGR